MTPKEAVELIPNFLISSNDSGSQDHSTLLSAYQMFDCYLDESNIKHPVFVLSDGHSSRFDSDALPFLRGKNRLFITLPDTTGITQLLGQIYQKLHFLPVYDNQQGRFHEDTLWVMGRVGIKINNHKHR